MVAAGEHEWWLIEKSVPTGILQRLSYSVCSGVQYLGSCPSRDGLGDVQKAHRFVSTEAINGWTPANGLGRYARCALFSTILIIGEVAILLHCSRCLLYSFRCAGMKPARLHMSMNSRSSTLIARERVALYQVNRSIGRGSSQSARFSSPHSIPVGSRDHAAFLRLSPILGKVCNIPMAVCPWMAPLLCGFYLSLRTTATFCL